ncbi:septation protein IspZ [Oligoflexaceae bacterium]|nr:septation protein IspZ [Oligoflexaceae bacterium]
MTFEAILAILLPAVVYVIVEKRKGLQVAIKVSLVLATLLVAYFVIRFDFHDKLLWLEYALLMALGFVSLRLNNDRFFKFQPVVVNGVFGTYVLIVFFTDGPILLRYIPLIEKMVADPQIIDSLKTERSVAVFTSMSWQLGVILLAHASLVAAAALKWSSVAWMWARLAIYPMLAAVALFAGLSS